MDTVTLRPYLVIPKLIEQPTWGGFYIAQSKKWQDKPDLAGKKIGQSYELYDKSNLSLTLSSDDPSFTGELADTKSVEQQSTVPQSVALSTLIARQPAVILGQRIVDTYGSTMPLLLKFTQALGNSFQLHIPDGVKDAVWQPKPESWYFFEPGIITCGVKEGQWDAYQAAMIRLDADTQAIAKAVQAGTQTYEQGKAAISSLVTAANPWQYVNVLRVEADTLLDLSPCGIHHSWEEDSAAAPLGNVVYEIQRNVMDDVATLRSFDKGKMSKEGKLRPLTIDEYFRFADRTKEANDPATHMRAGVPVARTSVYTHERILETKYYSMDRIRIGQNGGEFSDTFDTFRHVFVRSGSIDLTAGSVTVRVTSGHAVFVPAGCKTYSVRTVLDNTELLVSY